MIDEKIRKVRKQLNDSIRNKEDYKEIYKLSVELDYLIADYYNAKLKRQIEIS